MQLTDAQVMTIAIAVILLLSGLIYSNSRVTDAKETLRAGIQALRAEMKASMDRIENLLKIHELEHHR